MPTIDVRDETGELMGTLDMPGAIDSRCKNIIMPVLEHGRFNQLVLSVERVRYDEECWMALRASSQDIVRLARLENFTPAA